MCLCCHLGACRVRAWSSSSVSVVAAHGSGRTRGNIQRNNSGRTFWSTRARAARTFVATNERAASVQQQLATPARRTCENIARRAVLGRRQGGGGGGGSSERHRTARRWRGRRAEAPWTEPTQLLDGRKVFPFRRMQSVYAPTLRRGLPQEKPTAPANASRAPPGELLGVARPPRQEGCVDPRSFFGGVGGRGAGAGLMRHVACARPRFEGVAWASGFFSFLFQKKIFFSLLLFTFKKRQETYHIPHRPKTCNRRPSAAVWLAIGPG